MKKSPKTAATTLMEPEALASVAANAMKAFFQIPSCSILAAKEVGFYASLAQLAASRSGAPLSEIELHHLARSRGLDETELDEAVSLLERLGLVSLDEEGLVLPVVYDTFERERRKRANREAGWDARRTRSVLQMEPLSRPAALSTSSETPPVSVVSAFEAALPQPKEANQILAGMAAEFCDESPSQMVPEAASPQENEGAKPQAKPSQTRLSHGENDASDVVAYVPTNTGLAVEVTRAYIENYRGIFPYVKDLVGEARRAANWCEVSPNRRKTPRGVARFLRTWLDNSNRRSEISQTASIAATSRNGFGQGGYAPQSVSDNDGLDGLNDLDALGGVPAGPTSPLPSMLYGGAAQAASSLGESGELFQ